jgi:hypothetical protein
MDFTDLLRVAVIYVLKFMVIIYSNVVMVWMQLCLTLGTLLTISYCYSQCRAGHLEGEHGGTTEGEFS